MYCLYQKMIFGFLRNTETAYFQELSDVCCSLMWLYNKCIPSGWLHVGMCVPRAAGAHASVPLPEHAPPRQPMDTARGEGSPHYSYICW